MGRFNQQSCVFGGQCMQMVPQDHSVMSGECGRASQPQASDLGVCRHQHSAGKGEEKQKYRAEKKSLWFISELVGLRSSR